MNRSHGNGGKERISVSKTSLRFRYVTLSGKSNSLPYSYSKIATRSGTSNFSFRFFSILDLAITKSIHGTQSVCLTSLCFRCLRISEQIYSLGTVCRQAMLLACKYQRPVSLISTARLTAWVDNIAYKTGRNDQAFSWSKWTWRKCYKPSLFLGEKNSQKNFLEKKSGRNGFGGFDAQFLRFGEKIS